MANNITVLDSTGTSKNWATSEGSDSQHRQHVVPTDANGTAVIGTTTSAAVTTDTTGTVIGFLRGLVVWFTRLGKADGATFTRGSSYVWPGLAGIYESTVSTLTAGKVALARLTSRGAVVTAGDIWSLTLTTATPTPSGSDILDEAGAVVTAGDLSIRDTTSHYFVVPMSAKNMRVLTVAAEIGVGFDQPLTMTIYANHSATTFFGIAKLAEVTIPAASGLSAVFASGSVGTGGATGGASIDVDSFYSVPAMSNLYQYYWIKLKADTSPTVGDISLVLTRGV